MLRQSVVSRFVFFWKLAVARSGLGRRILSAGKRKRMSNILSAWAMHVCRTCRIKEEVLGRRVMSAAHRARCVLRVWKQAACSSKSKLASARAAKQLHMRFSACAALSAWRDVTRRYRHVLVMVSKRRVRELGAWLRGWARDAAWSNLLRRCCQEIDDRLVCAVSHRGLSVCVNACLNPCGVYLQGWRRGSCCEIAVCVVRSGKLSRVPAGSTFRTCHVVLLGCFSDRTFHQAHLNLKTDIFNIGPRDG
jgi:hypothetical protein